MSYIEKARQNKANADKAAAFDQMQKQQREENLYIQGTNDAYSAVEREMMRRAEEQAMDRKMQEAARRYESRGANDYNPTFGQAVKDAGNWVGNKLGGLADTFVNTVTGETPRQAQRYNKEAEMLRRDVEAEAARKAMMGQK